MTSSLTTRKKPYESGTCRRYPTHNFIQGPAHSAVPAPKTRKPHLFLQKADTEARDLVSSSRMGHIYLRYPSLWLIPTPYSLASVKTISLHNG
jgi:hypothetical protein